MTSLGSESILQAALVTFKYYNNGRIGELPLCFFVFFSKQFRTQPRWFFVFSGERNLFFTLAERWMINFGIKSWLLKIWSYSFEGLCFSYLFGYRVTFVEKVSVLLSRQMRSCLVKHHSNNLSPWQVHEIGQTFLETLPTNDPITRYELNK